MFVYISKRFGIHSAVCLHLETFYNIYSIASIINTLNLSRLLCVSILNYAVRLDFKAYFLPIVKGD